MNRIYLTALVLVVFACKDEKKKHVEDQNQVEVVEDSLIFPEENHFKSIRQITFGGDNAEAYWSFDDKQIVFQSNNKNWNVSCDQMFLMDIDETFKDKNTTNVINRKRTYHLLIFFAR